MGQKHAERNEGFGLICGLVHTFQKKKGCDSGFPRLFLTAVCTTQAHILVDCGEDNVCIPDLKLSARP